MMQVCHTEYLINIVLKCTSEQGWVIYLKLLGSHLHNDQKRGEHQSLGKEHKTFI